VGSSCSGDLSGKYPGPVSRGALGIGMMVGVSSWLLRRQRRRSQG